MSVTRKDSPCRGFCTTALGDDVCKSCGRTFEEVTFWNQFSEEQKQAVWQRLEKAVDNPGTGPSPTETA